MFAFLARLAFGATAFTILIAGSVMVAPTPAQAITCPAFTPTNNGSGGFAITDCSEVLTVTQAGLNFVITPSFPPNGSPQSGAYNNSNYVLIGITNNTGFNISDLYVGGTPGQTILNLQANENLCAGSFAPSVSLTCNSTHNGAILQIAGSQVTVIPNDPGNPFAGSSITLNNYGDLIFTGLGLPPGDTAIFALSAYPTFLQLSGTTSVPEPGSFAVFGTGLLGVAFYRRRKRRLVKPQAPYCDATNLIHTNATVLQGN